MNNDVENIPVDTHSDLDVENPELRYYTDAGVKVHTVADHSPAVPIVSRTRPHHSTYPLELIYHHALASHYQGNGFEKQTQRRR